jgi:hypothetical protein
MRRRSSDGLFNLLTLLFVLLTIAVLAYVILLLTKTVRPPAGFAPITPTVPQVLQVPSSTPTATITLTPLPSNTPIPTSTTVPTKTKTPTPTETNTPLPTDTALPTDTPTLPPTLTQTLPPTLTHTPTVDPNLPTKTPPGFPFRLQEGTPALTSNLNTAIGCSFQGVAGQVYDMANGPALNLTVKVTSVSGFTGSAPTGSNQSFGASGWQVQTGAQPTNESFQVQVMSNTGVPLSPPVTVTFPGSCDQNLGLINFFQTRPY